jgi:hypothetical protein
VRAATSGFEEGKTCMQEKTYTRRKILSSFESNRCSLKRAIHQYSLGNLGSGPPASSRSDEATRDEDTSAVPDKPHDSIQQRAFKQSTPFPNLLLDKVMPGVSHTSWKVLCFIWRKTVGWNKEWDSVSLRQIARGTGVCRDTIIHDLLSLKRFGLIKEGQPGPRGMAAYGVMFDFDSHRTGPRNRPVDNTDRSSTPTRTGRKNRPEPVEKIDTQKTTITKTTETKSSPVGSSPEDSEHKLLEIWDDERGDLPAVRGLTNGRRRHCLARFRSHPNGTREKFFTDFRQAVRLASRTPFLRGENERGWKASFDWLIRNDENYLKVLEGQYGAADEPKRQPPRAIEFEKGNDE